MLRDFWKRTTEIQIDFCIASLCNWSNQCLQFFWRFDKNLRNRVWRIPHGASKLAHVLCGQFVLFKAEERRDIFSHAANGGVVRTAIERLRIALKRSEIDLFNHLNQAFQASAVLQTVCFERSSFPRLKSGVFMRIASETLNFH